jgi:hypothetical protein
MCFESNNQILNGFGVLGVGAIEKGEEYNEHKDFKNVIRSPILHLHDECFASADSVE